ncbi:MAG TPA: zinc-ribbon domain-containing protein [Clostridiaceae bacterium]|jgi:membrane protease subunit (stomatin/prohibitin family)|nr:zinc-ribbon domain-containing protein [Clostridiaceae bacterium]
MGLFDFIKNQFIEVIEWTDDSQDTMVYRFPVANKEIKMGAQLTVRESQTAIFVNEGVIADVFFPGRHVLSTRNMPVMTKLQSWKYGFDSPFKAEVYFINMKQFLNQKWGTANPVMMRDAEFGMLRLRAYGIYSFKVAWPEIFLKEVFGTSSRFDTQSITEQLKRAIISGVSDMLGECRIPAIDLARHYDELSERAREKLNPIFEKLGLQLISFFIENISLPEEVEKVIDKRTSMGVLGDMKAYSKYQAAEAIRDAAKNPSGGSGAGMSFGAGAAIGSIMVDAFSSMNKSNSSNEETARDTKVCPECGQKSPTQAKFCISCGKPLVQPGKKCTKCGFEINTDVKFCPECGTRQEEQTCKKCGAKLGAGAKFCSECGTAV